MARYASWLVVLGLSLTAHGPDAAAAADKRKTRAEKEAKISADTQVRLGKRFEALGDIGAALGLYQQVLAEKPDHEPALRALITLALRTAYAEDAYDYCVKLVAKKPNDPEAALWLATALNARNQPEAALKELERAEGLRNRPDPGVLWTQRGIAYDLLGRHNEAQRAFSQAVSLAPADRSIPLKMALSLAISQDYQAALRILQMQVNDPAMEGPVRETLAQVYALSGQTDTAVEIAGTAMPKDAAAAMRPYFAALPSLSSTAKAQAIYFRKLPPATAQTGSAATRGVAPATASPTNALLQSPVAAAPSAPQAPSVQVPTVAPVSAATQPAVAAPAVAAPAVGKPQVALPKGVVWLQVASFNDRNKLAEGWQDVRRAAEAAVAGYKPYAQSAKVSGGTQYRLLIGPFQSKAEAEGVLEKLAGRGIKTVVKRDVSDIEPLYR